MPWHDRNWLTGRHRDVLTLSVSNGQVKGTYIASRPAYAAFRHSTSDPGRSMGDRAHLPPGLSAVLPNGRIRRRPKAIITRQGAGRSSPRSPKPAPRDSCSLVAITEPAPISTRSFGAQRIAVSRSPPRSALCTLPVRPVTTVRRLADAGARCVALAACPTFPRTGTWGLKMDALERNRDNSRQSACGYLILRSSNSPSPTGC